MSPPDDPFLACCRALPGVTEDVKWGDNLVFSVAEKMFAVFQLPDLTACSFKVDADLFPSLVEQPGIEPAPYLARHSWVYLADRTAVPAGALEDFLGRAHAIVAAKLPKKTRVALGLA